MESHSFSDPVRVFDSTIQPCWRVHVFRHGVDEPIGSIDVHAQSLPPRKNKHNKIVWKLPIEADLAAPTNSDPNAMTGLPSFGIHEQQRLWELFKEQRKVRRKQQKQQLPPARKQPQQDLPRNYTESSPLPTAAAYEEFHDDTSIHTPKVAAITSSMVTSASNGQESDGEELLMQQLNQQVPQKTPVSPMSFSSEPPPLESQSLNEESQAIAAASVPESTATIDTHHPSQSEPVPSPEPTPEVPRPPPGFGPMQDSPTSTSRNRSALPNATEYHNGQTSHHYRNQPSLDGSNCFCLLPVELNNFPTSLALRVASTFIELISPARSLFQSTPLTNGSEAAVARENTDRVTNWLAYYVQDAQSTLIMGTAQAVAVTLQERLSQWTNLSTVNATVKRWECDGWAAQTVGGDSHVGAGRQTVLVVLTGRTLQQHLLSFQLTLVIQEQMSNMFQIVNEILALSLLS